MRDGLARIFCRIKSRAQARRGRLGRRVLGSLLLQLVHGQVDGDWVRATLLALKSDNNGYVGRETANIRARLSVPAHSSIASSSSTCGVLTCCRTMIMIFAGWAVRSAKGPGERELPALGATQRRGYGVCMKGSSLTAA
jgi:hypothetical protein